MMKARKILLISLTIFILKSTNLLAVSHSDTLMFEAVKGSSIEMNDFIYIKKDGWMKLYKILEHPAFDSLMTIDIEEEILRKINYRKEEVGDTLRSADIFYIWKPYFEWLHYIDPHYVVSLNVPSLYINGKEMRRE